MATSGQLRILAACGCVLLVCMPSSLFVVGGMGAPRSGPSALRGTSISSYEPYVERQSEDGQSSAAWWLAPVTTFLAAAALGLCCGLVAAPEACQAKGQALQGITNSRPPLQSQENWTSWKDRMRIVKGEEQQVKAEASLLDAKIQKALQDNPKEKRVARAMQQMRDMSAKEMKTSERPVGITSADIMSM